MPPKVWRGYEIPNGVAGMNLQLVTHCTQHYLPRMRPYLDSLAVNWALPVWLLTVEFDAPV